MHNNINWARVGGKWWSSEIKKKSGEESKSSAASSQLKQDLVCPEEAFIKLLQLVRTIQAGMQNVEGSHGLSGSQLWTLWLISAQPGLRVTELAEMQHIHPSTASNLLDKLETRGLVRRERRDTDSRVVRLYLTDAGPRTGQEHSRPNARPAAPRIAGSADTGSGRFA